MRCATAIGFGSNWMVCVNVFSIGLSCVPAHIVRQTHTHARRLSSQMHTCARKRGNASSHERAHYEWMNCLGTRTRHARVRVCVCAMMIVLFVRVKQPRGTRPRQRVL